MAGGDPARVRRAWRALSGALDRERRIAVAQALA